MFLPQSEIFHFQLGVLPRILLLFWMIKKSYPLPIPKTVEGAGETNNSDLRFFWVTLMIYGENVIVPNFSQSADLITEWVI